MGTVRHFLVTLRDPVDLFESAYRQVSAILDFRGSFREFVDLRPDVLNNGFYARALLPWIDEFGRERFLFLCFERMLGDVDATKHRLEGFLGLDTGLFPVCAGTRHVNESFSPRFRRTYGVMKRTANRMHRSDLSWVAEAGRRIGLKRLMHTRNAATGPELTTEQRAELRSLDLDDQHELEQLIGEDLSAWSAA
jgi:hypothetical protein